MDLAVSIVSAKFQRKPKLSPWQWAEQNVDYSRIPSYDSEWKGPYRIDYMPYLKEPMEACADLSIREVWMLACTRGGKSENLLLTVMRYMLATCPPYAMLYLGGQQEKVEQFSEKRIKRGMLLSDVTADIFKAAEDNGRIHEHTMNFGACDFIISWANNKQVGKGDSYPVILADEVSSWPAYKADTMRERQSNIRFPKLIGVSSPDAESRRSSDEDPIFQEYDDTDKRIYQSKCPKSGELFTFRMGGPDQPDGVKWDVRAKRADGSWDLEVVENTAYYVTPGGARLEEKDRLPMIAEGVWTPTAVSRPWKRGYKVTRFMTPFRSGNFGDMARAFLEAKKKQDAGQFDEHGRAPLRVFIYERLAEKFYTEKRVPEMTEIEARKCPYEIGQRVTKIPAYGPIYIGKETKVLMTVDIQKLSEWWVCREWVDGGDSGLVALGQSNGLNEVREIGVKYRPSGVLIDNSYPDRAREIIEAVSRGVLKGSILSYGRDNLKDKHGQPREYEYFWDKDPYEGTANAGLYRCNSVTFIPDRIKNVLFSLTNESDWHKWRVPNAVPEWYALQMTSEHCIDGKWIKIRRDNHIWDCEVLQVLGAKLYGMWRDSQPIVAPEAAPPAKEVEQSPAAVESVDPSKPICPKCRGQIFRRLGNSQYQCLKPNPIGGGKCLNVWTDHKQQQWEEEDEE